MADKKKKSEFMIKGVIQGKDNPANGCGYVEGVGANSGTAYRSIRFKVKTSNDNIIPVELYGGVYDFAYIPNGAGVAATKIPWASRFTVKTPEGKTAKTDYDFVKKINDDFKDGDTVRLFGEFKNEEYTGKDGIARKSVKFIIKRIYQSESVLNFDSQTFDETNEFVQDVVIQEVEVDNTYKKVILHVYIMKKNGYDTMTMEIEMNEKNQDFIKKVKTLKFGDFMQVIGRINYKSVNEVIDDEWGREIIKESKKNIEVIKIDGSTYVSRMYKEEDFAKVETKQTSSNSDWNAVEKTSNNNELPFLDLDD